ncbi:MAG: hypothetical protein WAT39_09765 [Planctomycetota bacterium]
MHRIALVATLAGALASAQEGTATPQERVLAVLRHDDPLRAGKGAGLLLLPDRSLDAAIRELAADAATSDQLARRRALRLARVLDLAQRVQDGAKRRDLAWWLAFDEIECDVPDPGRGLLLARAFATSDAVAAAEREFNAAHETARRFCEQWNESRSTTPTDAEREQYRKNDELEAALTKAADAAVPGLLHHLTTPPEVTFADRRFTARHQVRALLALSAIQKVPAAMPYFVMHAAGPSLTQSADAALAVQGLGGVALGAAMLQPGDDEALLSWWTAHRRQHTLVLDHLVHHVVHATLGQLHRDDDDTFQLAWSAVHRLDRVLGNEAPLARDGGLPAWRARLETIETGWLIAQRRERR